MTLEKYAEMVRAVLADGRLSTDARVLVLHVLGKGDGAHEIRMPEIGGVLGQAKDKRIQNAISQAEAFGWLAYTWKTGRGHFSRFEFRNALQPDPSVSTRPEPEPSAEDETVSEPQPSDSTIPRTDSTNNSTVPEQDLNASHGRDHGDQKTSSSSSSPSARGLTRQESERLHSDLALDLLRQELGTQQGAVDEMAVVQLRVAPAATFGWAAYIRTAYLDESPADFPVVAGVPPPERPQKVALALRRYAADGAKYDNRLFKTYLKTVIRENATDDGQQDAGTRRRSGGYGPRSSTNSGRAPAGVATAPQAPRRSRGFGT